MSEKRVYWYMVTEVSGTVPEDWQPHTWKETDVWQDQEYEVIFYDEDRQYMGMAVAVYRKAAPS